MDIVKSQGTQDISPCQTSVHSLSAIAEAKQLHAERKARQSFNIHSRMDAL
jgi:hypothetical protein